MTATTLKEYEHPSANAVGLLDTRFDGRPLVHFRGIKYASIPERFAAPVYEQRVKQTKLDATKFGPRCPQIPVDVRDLMQIPKDLEQWPPEVDDEFECLNLNITVPEKIQGKLPVLIWVYGGAQVVSFSSSAHRLCETGPLAAQAISSGRPIVLVNPNYRLNLFAYGDGKPNSEKNLHIQDLQLAVRWTVDNIAAFGGDPARITIAGESAGSILTHALCLTLPPSISISRAILCSGSIGTSRFQKSGFFEPTLERVLKAVREAAAAQKVESVEDLTLKTAPVSLLVAGMAAGSMMSIPLREPDDLADLPSLLGSLTRLEALMVGDCEFEGVLWMHGVRLLSDEALRECFLGSSELEEGAGASYSSRNQCLASTYLDSPSSKASDTPTLGLGQAQSGALDFMADYLFHVANHDIISSVASSNTKVFSYVFDEANPFPDPKSPAGVPRAHHGVDLLALWDSYASEYPVENDGAFANVSKAYRDKIIAFVNGEEPWDAVQSAKDSKETYAYAFGPRGAHGEITQDEYAQRRRVEKWAVMKDVGDEVVDGVWRRLMSAVEKAIRETMAAMAAAAAAKGKVGVEGATDDVGKVKLDGGDGKGKL
ncbi:Lipase 3 [Cyphellophora attinorum]|uniref:Carboxylic ester hydrolase n=1 Tax=Cyphellophora attinorum TaxID=1664694 RepID=A0A0N1HA81_9EURO|nr:Lipase 3 [Phialophora attinorum]KPI44697.1 Lipase 3 [Phialophora attinorum]